MFHTESQFQKDVIPFNELTLKNGSNSGEVGHVRKDGSTFPTLMSTTVLRDSSGKPTGLVSTTRDITKQSQAEAELHASEIRFRALFNSSKDAIMTLAPPDWKFTSGNPAILNIFNIKDEAEFIALNPGDVSPEIQADGSRSEDKIKEMIQIAMEEGSNFFHWTHKTVTGEVFPATVLLTRVDLANKPFLQATVRDITKQAQMEQQIKNALRRREQQVRLLEVAFHDAHGVSLTSRWPVRPPGPSCRPRTSSGGRDGRRSRGRPRAALRSPRRCPRTAFGRSP
jgi:PAS domain S-box-containing protein